MGILCCLKQLTDEEVDFYQKHPKKLADLLEGSDDDDDIEDATSTDIGKVWHLVHYLLTGKPDKAEAPNDFLIHGGEDAPGADFGYGDGHVFRSLEVKTIATALENLDTSKLQTRFELEKINRLELYRRPFAEDDFEWAHSQILHLKTFVKSTAERGFALLVYFS